MELNNAHQIWTSFFSGIKKAVFSGIKKAVVGLLRKAGRLNRSFFIISFELNMVESQSSRLRIVALQESKSR
jgi:hypothetical protein